MPNLQLDWPFLQISRCSDKICRLPFKLQLGLAINIACASAPMADADTNIRFYTDALITFLFSHPFDYMLAYLPSGSTNSPLRGLSSCFEVNFNNGVV